VSMSHQSVGNGAGAGLHWPDSLKLPESMSWSRIASTRGLSRSPRLSLPLKDGKRVQFVTDRVRAAPAISPTISMNLGVGAIGLGLWGLLFPRNVARTFGLPRNDAVVRTVFGLRELVTGFRLAGDPTKAETLWARVAGDLFDISVLSAASVPPNKKRGNARFALKAVLVITALDVLAAIRLSNVQRNCVD
jgi:hypothetical protein